ncbi:MAG: hypothetical protein ABWY20_20320, partial [Mycobacterium sp.]
RSFKQDPSGCDREEHNQREKYGLSQRNGSAAISSCRARHRGQVFPSTAKTAPRQNTTAS